MISKTPNKDRFKGCDASSFVAFDVAQATRWLSWYGVGLASADRLLVVVRIPAGPLGSLKCDPPKGNRRRPIFFSVQRLHGFRQVVTHVQSQQKDEL